MNQVIIIPFSSVPKPIFTSPIAIEFTQDNTYISNDGIHIFVFDHTNLNDYDQLQTILTDDILLKVSTKNHETIQTFYNVRNMKHISILTIITGKSPKSLPNYNKEIQFEENNPDVVTLPLRLLRLIVKYIKIIDYIPKKYRKEAKGTFYNKKRDASLIYLTIFNDILLFNGPTSFITLVNLAKKYPNLTQLAVNPALALEGLIEIKALISDRTTTLIYLPEQIK